MYGPASGMDHGAMVEWLSRGRASARVPERYAGTDAARWMVADRLAHGRPVGNNTRLYARPDGAIALRLHRTDVATMAPDGTITLDSGGWRTVTTRERINAALRNDAGPWSAQRGHVWQDRGVWYYQRGRDAATGDWTPYRIPFFDGMRIAPDGTVLNLDDAPTLDDAATLRRRIAQYARDYVATMETGAMPAPSAGDCLFCQLAARGTVNDDRDRIPDVGADHLESHLDEAYYVPSLLMAVLRARGIVPGRFAGSAWLPAIVDGTMRARGIADDGATYRRWIAAYIRSRVGA